MNFRVLTTLGHWNSLCFRFRVYETEGLSNCNQKQKQAFLSKKGRCCITNFIRISLLTVLLFQHLFQTQCLVLSSTFPEGSTPFPPLQQLFSLYLAFIECSCVWINVVDIKSNFCLSTSFTANSTDSSLIKSMNPKNTWPMVMGRRIRYYNRFLPSKSAIS